MKFGVRTYLHNMHTCFKTGSSRSSRSWYVIVYFVTCGPTYGRSACCDTPFNAVETVYKSQQVRTVLNAGIHLYSSAAVAKRQRAVHPLDGQTCWPVDQEVVCSNPTYGINYFVLHLFSVFTLPIWSNARIGFRWSGPPHRTGTYYTVSFLALLWSVIAPALATKHLRQQLLCMPCRAGLECAKLSLQ